MVKKISICILFFCLLISFDSFSQKKAVKRDTKDDCLAVIGFFYNKTLINKINVYLYEGLTIIDSIKTTSMKDFGFVLKKNKEYSIKIASKGYYPRLISINTTLSDDVNTLPVFIFEFDIELLPMMKGMDDYFTDFPIAKVEYDTKIEKFGYSKKYTASIQKELNKVQEQIKIRKSR